MTRKQLSNIFAAREDMLKAVGKMEQVFANGEIEEAVREQGCKAAGTRGGGGGGGL